MRALLISTYEMGRQPFGLASPAARLGAAGWHVACADLSRERLRHDLVAFYLPMHTATRLAGPVIARVRALTASARLCAYGVYAPPNAVWLRSLGVQDVLGGEFEDDLAALAAGLAAGGAGAPTTPPPKPRRVPRVTFVVPDRSGLPPLERYATLQRADGAVVAGYTEASRGCRHRCRHCPIVPIYGGQFRIVPAEVVLADVAGQVAAGARHITFGDPDFFNGPTHAMRVLDGLHAAHPSLTYDVTIKIEHLLRHRDLLPRLRATGCAFVTSAVEAIDDAVLARLDKGHTRRDFVEAVAICRAAGITLVPTFVAFHPWITLTGYCDLLDTIAELDLADQVAPIQLAIRLLIPEGSRLLELDDVRRTVGPFDAATLTYRWTHADPRVDVLQQEVAAIAGLRHASPRRAVFEEVRALARARAALPPAATAPVRARATVPYLNEPWYC